jgi:hypothetical protein
MQSIGGLRSDSKVTIQEEGHYTKKVHCKAPSELEPRISDLVFTPVIELVELYISMVSLVEIGSKYLDDGAFEKSSSIKKIRPPYLWGYILISAMPRISASKLGIWPIYTLNSMLTQ